MNPIESFCKLAVADGLSRDPNTLRRLDKMRGRVEARVNPRSSQAGFDHGARGTFAIRTRDVNRAVGPLRMIQRAHKHRHTVKPKLGGLDLVAKRIEKPD